MGGEDAFGGTDQCRDLRRDLVADRETENTLGQNCGEIAREIPADHHCETDESARNGNSGAASKTRLQLTPQQEAIYAEIRNGANHAIVLARAGTGKTSTAVGFLSECHVPGNVGFVAFNAHIAEELKSRLPPEITACTLHRLGLTSLLNNSPNSKFDPKRADTLARQIAPGADYPTREVAVKLQRLKKLTFSRNYDFEHLAREFDIDLSECRKQEALELAGKIYQRSMDTDGHDFDDMIWQPLVHGFPVQHFDLLCVDEGQDLNPAQQELAWRATGEGGRLIVIGDDLQAIYGFAGADSNSLGTLQEKLALSSTLPLTITWRCPVSHVELARKLCPDLEAAPGAKKGIVGTLSEEEIIAKVSVGDLVISRRNSPLVALTYKLVLGGKPAFMRGREIGQGLLTLVKRLKPKSVEDLTVKIDNFTQRERKRMIKAGCSESAIQSMEDRASCLWEIASQVDDLDQMKTWITEHFDENPLPGDCIVLSSIHRAKGLEADRVFILDTQNLPLAGKMLPWQRQQEKNLAYIAATRAKEELYFEDTIPTIFGV